MLLCSKTTNKGSSYIPCFLILSLDQVLKRVTKLFNYLLVRIISIAKVWQNVKFNYPIQKFSTLSYAETRSLGRIKYVEAQQLNNVLLIILCSYYLRTLYGAHSYYPISTLLDCSVGGVSPPPGAICNRREDFFCFATLGTLLLLLHLCHCWFLVSFLGSWHWHIQREAFLINVRGKENMEGCVSRVFRHAAWNVHAMIWRAVWDGCKILSMKQELEVRWISQDKQYRALQELNGTWRQVTELYAHVGKVPLLWYGVGRIWGLEQLPACGRSISGRSDARLRLWAH